MEFYKDYKPQFSIFHDLMKFRVREILLVSSFYDAFVLEEDGRLSEKIFSEYIDLNLRFVPRITRASSATEALKMLKKSSFNMVITMTRIADMDPQQFGAKVKELKPDMPVVLLTYEWIDSDTLMKLRYTKSIDKIFLWSGDTRILLAIIKYVEDLKNVDNDTKLGVRAILIIEDSPKFYSMFLPLIYTEIMTQTRLLISEGVNDLHRLLRMRARPKILMAETYEQGIKIYNKYKKNLLGVLSDISFPREDKIDPNAGFRFARKVKKDISDLPFLLQSSDLENKTIAYKKGLDFLNKNSNNLLHDLSNFILSNFGFGDFVFKDKQGEETGRAKNLYEFEKMIQIIPAESLEFHAKRNHFSIWLRARTEFDLADKFRPKKASDFKNIEDIREFILSELQKLLYKNQYGVITDFEQTQFDSENSFIRLGNGSLGGKARGIAFINTLLAQTKLYEKFKDVEIKTPYTFVICSEVFEEFIEINKLQKFAISETDNDKISKKFMKKRLPDKIVQDLKTLLINIKYPIAIRSSSILEDSQTLPFAGLYSTFLIPNNNPLLNKRLIQLCNAIKLVYASVFFKSPKEYIRNTNFSVEEEKMAVIIQQAVGQNYNNNFYPVVSGVAQSYNYYPISHMEPDDGVIQLALGLGRTIAEGDQVFRFSPKYPEMNPPFSSIDEYLKKSQNYFFSINLSNSDLKIINDETFSLNRLNISDAEEHDTLFFVASTYSAEDNVIRDTVSIKGPRIITFANILKFNLFPLSEILNEVLEIGREAFGSHIEIEFALNLFKDKKKRHEIELLQIRPMIAGKEKVNISLDNVNRNDIICKSEHSMGNGVFLDLYDLVYVDPYSFDASKSRKIANEVGQINQKFIDKNLKYILIGFGRWGTSDPWLGIPVEWYQISKAKMIIESNLKNFNIDPSQGSHFFHNMIALQMGYFHIGRDCEEEFILWEWIKKQKTCTQTKYVKHIKFSKPFTVKINGRDSKGLILKPDTG